MKTRKINAFEFRITAWFAVILCVFSWNFAQAQAPEKMTYQSVIRNTTGALLANTTVGVQANIYQGAPNGALVYTETQTGTTNTNGLLSLEIGSVSPLQINWGNGPYYLELRIDPNGGTNYTISGSNQLLSVPYALHAKTSEDAFSGDYNDLTNTPVIPTVPTQVSAFTNDAGYITTEVDGSVTNEIQALSRSNDTIFLSNGGFVKLPAGFDGQYSSLTGAPTNVSAFTNDAGYLTNEIDGSITNEIQVLSISADTIFLSNGGFVKLPASNAWTLNGNAGTNPATNFIGTTNDVSLHFRVNNVHAGKIERANHTTFFGYNSGNNTYNTHETTGFGTNTLKSLTTGWGSTAVGFDVLTENTTGLFNTGMGYIAMNNMTTGQYNTGIGAWALQGNISGESNSSLGMFSFTFNTDGNYNTSLGAYTGYQNVHGSGNVFIGYQAGYYETGSNKLHIANSNYSLPLIYGDFSTSKIGLGTISPSKNLTVKGTVQIETPGTWAPGATARLYLGEDDNIWVEHIHSIGLNLNTADLWNITFRDGTDENMRIDGNGNVGIGTSAPQYRVDVVGDINFSGVLRKNGTPITFNGSETKVQAGSGIAVSGTGTVADPYIVSTPSKHYVGELYGGGIVFYVDQTGQHGLIASLADLSSAAYVGLYGVNIPNCSSRWDGAANTSAIMTAGAGAGSPAGLCDSYSAGGFTDWYLPSIDELSQIYQSIYVINKTLDQDGNPASAGIYPSTYVSSTQGTNITMWGFMFQTGDLWDNCDRGYSQYVRAIRAF